MTAHFPDGPAPRGPKWIPLHDLHAQIRAAIRARHYSPRTGKVYLGWIRRFIQFHGRQHPLRLGEREISEFLSHLATRSRVSPSTQNQALSAILFLYRNVLHKGLDRLTDIVRAKPAKRLPVVLTRQEVSAVLRQLSGTQLIMATLLYGAGLRVLECVRLRVKDIDLGTNTIIVRSGKGMKDRKTLLPQRIRGPLHQHLERMKQQHQEDIRQGGGWVELPTAVGRKYPNAGRQWIWQWVFPATRKYRDRATKQLRRHRYHESALQRAFKLAVLRAGIPKPASCHTLRHYAELGISGIRSPPTYSRTATTSAPFRSFWATETCRRR